MNAQGDPSRILLIAEGQVGDLILLTPSIRGIRRRFPESSIVVLVVERRNAGLVEGALIGPAEGTVLAGNPHISELIRVGKDLLRGLKGFRRLRAEFRILRYLRKQGFDAVVGTFPEDRFALWSYLSGAHRRVGEAKGLLAKAYNLVPPVPKGKGPVSSYYASLASLLGAEVDTAGPELFVDPESAALALSLIERWGFASRRFVLLHPGATGDYKIWPPERWAEVAAALVSRHRVQVLLCGGPGDRTVLDRTRAYLPPAVPVHVEEQIMVFAALAREASLVLSNDSGPRHVTVAVGTPSLALFRHHHDREWGIYPASETIRIIQGETSCPLCPEQRCEDRIPGGESFGAACLRGITARDVLDVVMDMLRSAPPAEKPFAGRIP